ncbi:MAG: putative ABC transporter permease [Clostridiales bacterium]|nr:putative ABC transporter permease [Clostridiales bacterium]
MLYAESTKEVTYMENVLRAGVLPSAACETDRRKSLTYSNMLWLFVTGSLLGVVGEGLHSLVKRGYWETHVVSLGLPLCVLYGLGAVGCYIGYCLLPRRNYIVQFSAYALVGTLIELLSGGLLDFGLGMRAWNYSYKPYNFRGYICLSASLGWGVVGVLFSLLIARLLDLLFSKLGGRAFKVLTVLFTVYLAVDFFLTGVSLYRWSGRHFGKVARTALGRFADRAFPDSFMAKRFIEWRFIQ